MAALKHIRVFLEKFSFLFGMFAIFMPKIKPKMEVPLHATPSKPLLGQSLLGFQYMIYLQRKWKKPQKTFLLLKSQNWMPQIFSFPLPARVCSQHLSMFGFSFPFLLGHQRLTCIDCPDHVWGELKGETTQSQPWSSQFLPRRRVCVLLGGGAHPQNLATM